MEILSDATFKGNVTFNKDVSIGSSENLLSVNNSSRSVSILKLSVSEFSIRSDGNGGAGIILNDQYLTKWSDLNSLLSFAPSSLSTTVSSNTSKINSACSTISSLCTKVNSLCTTVSGLAGLPKYCRKALDFDVPANCTKFLISGYPLIKQPEYMFMTKGGKDVYDTMSVVNVDLESRCDSTTGSTLGIIVTKSSGFEMKASDNYVLKYFY